MCKALRECYKCVLTLHNCRVHLLSVIELAIAGFGSLWALMAAFIHAGLNQTCKAYTESYPESKDFPYVNFSVIVMASSIGLYTAYYRCCSYYFPAQKEEDRVYFYEGINASRVRLG